MTLRTIRVLLVIVALLAVAPHLPAWYPIARDNIRALFAAPVVPAIVDTATATWNWLLAHQLLDLEVAGGALLCLGAVLIVRTRRRQLRTTESAILVMPKKVTPRPQPVPVVAKPVATVDLSFARPQPRPADVVAASPRRPGVMQPFERESRRAVVHELFSGGRTVAEIARITGIGQDAIRAVVGHG